MSQYFCRLVAVAAITLGTVCAAHAQRPAYTFIKIAEEAPGSVLRISDATFPSVSSDGRVAFFATTRTGNVEGIYTGTGADTPIAVAEAAGGFVGIGPRLAISPDGSRVVFSARTATGTGVYTASATVAGGSVTAIATTSGGTFSQFYDSFSPRLDNRGNVLFADTPHPVLFNAYRNIRTAPADGTGAVQTRFAGGGGISSVREGDLAVSDSGAMAFRAYRSETANRDEAIYLQSAAGGALTAIAVNGSYTSLDINNAGSVVYGDFPVAGGVRLSRYANGTTTTLLSTNGSVCDGIGVAAINNGGDVAFAARFQDGRDCVLTGANAVSDAALIEGDALFGSTIAQLNFGGNTAFNDAGQFAFSYSLTNGRYGIGLASRIGSVAVPEAATPLLMLLAGTGAVLTRRRIRSGAAAR